jgi:hypothetical protein
MPYGHIAVSAVIKRKVLNISLKPATIGGVMDRLISVGFERVGSWTMQSTNLVLNLDRMKFSVNILYAFVVSGEVKYIGKTVQALATRLMGYVRPVATQATNIRNHAGLKQALVEGNAVEIFALPDNGLMRYGQFHLNLAAGLEDSLIALLSPEWNGQRSTPSRSQPNTVECRPVRSIQPAEKPTLATVTPFPIIKAKNMDLLNELSTRVGRTFVTLGHRKPFELISVNAHGVDVRPASTATTRTIPFKQVQAAFDHLAQNHSINLAGIRSFSEMNPVYVAALIGDLPGVTVSTRPIALRFTPR